MGVRQKFFALSGVAGVIMAIVSIVGYFTASEAVENTTEKEIVAVITAAADEAEGWMLEKAQYGEATARMLSSFSAQDEAIVRRKEMTATYKGDKDITKFIDYVASDLCCYNIFNIIEVDDNTFYGSFYDELGDGVGNIA